MDKWTDGLGLDSGSSVISGWEWMRRKDSLSEANAHLLLEIIQGWKAFQGDRDGLEIAIRRLATLPSRAGRSEAEDRLLDTAIALETMYGLDAPEITYKLGTRARCILGPTGRNTLRYSEGLRISIVRAPLWCTGLEEGRDRLILRKCSQVEGSWPRDSAGVVERWKSSPMGQLSHVSRGGRSKLVIVIGGP